MSKQTMWLRDSNPGPLRLESNALPSELPCFGSQFYNVYFLNNLMNILMIFKYVFFDDFDSMLQSSLKKSRLRIEY